MPSPKMMNPFPAQDQYDRLAPVYNERWGAYTEATLVATLDGLSLHQGDRVLDLAAGTGELARRLRGLSTRCSIVGMDISRGMLMRGSGLRLQGDAARIPMASESFDRVLCTNAFHMFSGPAATLGEIHRVLRPGGLLTLTDWCDDYWTCRLCSLWLRLIDPAFHRTYSLRQCRNLLQQAGFDVIDVRKFKINWLWGLMRVEAQRGYDRPGIGGRSRVIRDMSLSWPSDVAGGPRTRRGNGDENQAGATSEWADRHRHRPAGS